MFKTLMLLAAVLMLAQPATARVVFIDTDELHRHCRSLGQDSRARAWYARCEALLRNVVLTRDSRPFCTPPGFPPKLLLRTYEAKREVHPEFRYRAYHSQITAARRTFAGAFPCRTERFVATRAHHPKVAPRQLTGAALAEPGDPSRRFVRRLRPSAYRW